MNIFDELESIAVELDEPPQVVGRWCVLRMQLDPATGERFNVGVMFKPQRGRAVWRMLRNVSGLRCLYGPDGAANASFAIAQAVAALERNEKLPDSWSIAAGPMMHASGASPQQVLDELFARVVPLARNELADEERLDTDDHRLSTVRLRRRVREFIAKRFDSKGTPDFWQDNPVRVATSDGRPLSLDLQVWTQSGTAPGAIASVTSAWYTSKFHRDSYLNTAFRALSEARQLSVVSRATAGLYVLRPMNDARFTTSQIAQIDNELDELEWAMSKIKVDVHAFDNERSLAERLLLAA